MHIFAAVSYECKQVIAKVSVHISQDESALYTLLKT